MSNIKTVKHNASWIITDDKDKRKVGSIVKTFGNSYDVTKLLNLCIEHIKSKKFR